MRHREHPLAERGGRPSPRGPRAIAVAVLVLPLVGAVAMGESWRQFFLFPPPLEVASGYVRFSWWAAGAVMLLLGAIAVSWLLSCRSQGAPGNMDARVVAAGDGRGPRENGIVGRQPFPLWGWLALAWTLAWWVLAWTRFPWFAGLQVYTFFPLWVGFIVAMNAATQSASGTCLMRRAPRIWLMLFAASAVFWWAFEWLNRFVRNWHYLAVEEFGPVGYAVHATACFSTVLPAVAAVAEWLSTRSGLRATLAAGPRWTWFGRRSTAIAFGAIALLGLLGTGAYPTWCYPALWVAPLLLALAWIMLVRRETAGGGSVVDEICRGDWSRAATWMLAALVCGFFWEMWNWRSVAKWIYTVPGVERWFVFEMPLLGYAGYLPFGLECLLVVERFAARDRVACAATPQGSS